MALHTSASLRLPVARLFSPSTLPVAPLTRRSWAAATVPLQKQNTPPALTKVQQHHRRTLITVSSNLRGPRRTYYTSTRPVPSPYTPAEAAILSAALSRVPTLGFTPAALTAGATDAGYLPASANLFPRGPFDLVLYHHVTSRLDLKNRVQFPLPPSSASSNPSHGSGTSSKPLSTTAKVRALLIARLQANAPFMPQYATALGLMSLAGNIPASLAELARLVDEIWYLAGDVSVDSSWYSKRAMLAGVYASAEMFMTQDNSKDYIETEEFVDRRLDDVRRAGNTVGAVGEWLGFTAGSAVNVARSLGARI